VVGTYQQHPLVHFGQVLVRDNHHEKVLFKEWLAVTEELGGIAERAKTELRGKSVACSCGIKGDCHGDVLLEISSEEASAA
jgi:hypothetical protein